MGFAAWVPPLIRANWDNPLLGGPFDVADSEGYPLVDANTRQQVMRRLYPGSFNQQQPPNTTGQTPPPPTPQLDQR